MIKQILFLMSLFFIATTHANTLPTSTADINTAPLEEDKTHDIYFFLKISKPLTRDVSVDYRTEDVTAIAGDDYQATSGTATILAGQTYTLIAVSILGDVQVEENEIFNLIISNPQGASFPNGITEISKSRTITNDDSDTELIVPIISSLFTSQTNCTAPCGVMFDATETRSGGIDEPFHELHYAWNYGDLNSTYQQRPDIDANISHSPLGAHVYNRAGTYTVTLTVSSKNGATSTQTTSIVVNEPTTVYSQQTYCVSNSNNFSACPTQDSNFHFTSFADAANFLGKLRFDQGYNPTQVLFRAGDTFYATERITIRNLTAELKIASYDTGSKPIIKIDPNMTDIALFFVHDSSQVVITDLNFMGDYVPTKGTGNHPTAIWLYLGMKNVLVYRNEFSGLGINIYPHGGTNTATGVNSEFIMIVDNKISNWQDYGIFGEFGYLSTLLANSIKQDENAVSGSEAKCGTCVPNYPDHGPLRTANSDHLLIQYNTMFNNAGWSSGGLAHQPNIRLGTGGTSHQSVIADNLLEGGFTTISMTPANPGIDSAGVKADVIIERNQLIASENTWQLIDMGLGGSTIRNNKFIKPNNASPSIGTGSFEAAIVFKVSDDRTTADNLNLINRIYNNTFISLAQTTAPNAAFLEVENNFSHFKLDNNIVYLPFVEPGAEAGLISWQHNGLKDNIRSHNNLIYAPNTQNYVWNNGISLSLSSWQTSGNDNNSLIAAPLFNDINNYDLSLSITSPAIDAGQDNVGANSDINGTIRIVDIDIGAYEFK